MKKIIVKRCNIRCAELTYCEIDSKERDECRDNFIIHPDCQLPDENKYQENGMPKSDKTMEIY